MNGGGAVLWHIAKRHCTSGMPGQVKLHLQVTICLRLEGILHIILAWAYQPQACKMSSKRKKNVAQVRVFSQKFFLQKSLDLSKDVKSISLILVKSVILWKKLLPGVELQEIECELSLENGRILKRSTQWHRPTGRRHHLAKVFHAMLYLRCTTIVVSERMHAFTHQPTEKGEKRTCPRSAWQVWGETTHKHLLLSFLSSLPHQLPWHAPNLVNNSATSASKSLQLAYVVQHKNKKCCSARWNEGKVVTVLYRIVLVNSKYPRFQSVLRRNPGEKNALKQTPCFSDLESSEAGDGRMWYQMKAWGKTYQTTVVVWLPGEHTKRHDLRKWCHCVVPFAGYAHYAQSFGPISALHSAAGSYKCEHARCMTCATIVNLTRIKLKSESRPIHGHFTCETHALVYLITCSSCNAVHVGETGQKLRERLNGHRADIRNGNDTPVGVHFCQPGHELRVSGLELTSKNATSRKVRERSWIDFF